MASNSSSTSALDTSAPASGITPEAIKAMQDALAPSIRSAVSGERTAGKRHQAVAQELGAFALSGSFVGPDAWPTCRKIFSTVVQRSMPKLAKNATDQQKAERKRLSDAVRSGALYQLDVLARSDAKLRGDLERIGWTEFKPVKAAKGDGGTANALESKPIGDVAAKAAEAATMFLYRIKKEGLPETAAEREAMLKSLRTAVEACQKAALLFEATKKGSHKAA